MNVSKLRHVPLRSEACLVPPAETVNTSVKRPFVTLLICFLPLNYYRVFSLSLALPDGDLSENKGMFCASLKYTQQKVTHGCIKLHNSRSP